MLRYKTTKHRKKFSLWENELNHKQPPRTFQKQPSEAIYFQNFLQKIPILESFFWSDYKLTVQSGDNIIKWPYQLLRKLSGRQNIIDVNIWGKFILSSKGGIMSTLKICLLEWRKSFLESNFS